ncbi:COG3178 Predicted phosphotransferase related to Ser/Thr protein kinases [Candidatus Pelagibacterales bacterium]
MINKDRLKIIKNFLKKNYLENYKIKQIKGDASFRKYFRIYNKNKSYILASAETEKKSNILNYVLINKILNKQSIKAPIVLDFEYKSGLALLEDFGNKTYLQLVKNSKNKLYIYKSLIKFLVKLQRINFKTNIFRFQKYNFKILKKEIDLFFVWYLPYIAKIKSNPKIIRLRKLLLKILKNNFIKNNYFVHRDFHISNLMECGLAFKNKIGIIDTQDALIGSRAYDIVSLIDDVRIKTTPDLKEKLLDYYLSLAKKEKNFDIKQFKKEFSILSVQRAMKIIGIFSRLFKRDRKNRYLKLIPYTWTILNKRLEDPIFKDVRVIINQQIKLRSKYVN